MNINDVVRSHSIRLKTITGKSFFGEIFAPPTQGSTVTSGTNVPTPRILRVGAKCNVGCGEVFLSPQGRRYLIADHSDNDSVRLNAKTFRLYEVPLDLTWEREVKSNDLVTGVPKDKSVTVLGPLMGSLERPTAHIDSLQVAKLRFDLVTGSAVETGDTVDGKRVRQVVKQLGIYFAEVE